MCKLSICIPTYDRLDWVDENIKRLDTVSDSDFEVVVVTEPSDSENMDRFGSRNSQVRLFRNENHVGFPGSILKLVDKSKGDYVLFSSDEDYIIPDKIPDIIDLTAQNNEISRIFTGANNEADHGMYEPSEALRWFWFKQRHLTGCLLQRSSLKTEHCARYTDEKENPLGPYITQILSVQAMKAGKTMYSDMNFYGRGEQQISEHEVDYSTFKNRARQCSQRAADVIPQMINEPQLADYLLTEESKRAGLILLRALKQSPQSASDVFTVFKENSNLLSSPQLWTSLPVYFIEYLLSGKTRKENVW